MDENGDRLLRREHSRRRVGFRLGAFQEWEVLPDDANLVSFYLGPRGALAFNGFWQMPEHRLEVRSRNTNVQLCWKLKTLDGFGIPDPNA